MNQQKVFLVSIVFLLICLEELCFANQTVEKFKGSGLIYQIL